jgi:hypothetical protein
MNGILRAGMLSSEISVLQDAGFADITDSHRPLDSNLDDFPARSLAKKALDAENCWEIL